MKIGHYKTKCKSNRTIHLFLSALFCKKIKFQTQKHYIFQIYYELLNVRVNQIVKVIIKKMRTDYFFMAAISAWVITISEGTSTCFDSKWASIL